MANNGCLWQTIIVLCLVDAWSTSLPTQPLINGVGRIAVVLLLTVCMYSPPNIEASTLDSATLCSARFFGRVAHATRGILPSCAGVWTWTLYSLLGTPYSSSSIITPWQSVHAPSINGNTAPPALSKLACAASLTANKAQVDMGTPAWIILD
jgi:hypothetical protein